jgi:glucose/arabinose dehydrogenase
MDEFTRPNRRRFLATGGLALTAGCSAPIGDTGRTDTPSPGDSTPPGTPPDDGLSHDVEDWDRYDPDWEAPSSSPTEGAVGTEILVENLEIPWGLSFAPTGELFITERVGRVLKFESGEVTEVLEPRDAIDAGSIPPDASADEKGWWVEGGEGGLLGVAVHPGYPDPAYVYAYYTTDRGGGRHNRVARFDASADDPAATEEILVGDIPGEKYHDGGRIGFGPRNYLWITTGDAGEDQVAADPASLGGKVLRITADGDPAPGNPDLGSDADRRVFSIGHRNPQGITWMPDATPVETEHGPSARDEVNVLEAGGNYGWPDAREEAEYRKHGDARRPVVNTGNTTWAPTGCIFYTGEQVPQWRNRLVIGTLKGQHINVVTLTPEGSELPPADGDARRFDASWLDSSYTATAHRFFEDELGRVRLVTQGPDGHLYAITSNRDGRPTDPFPTERDDVLVRLTGE